MESPCMRRMLHIFLVESEYMDDDLKDYIIMKLEEFMNEDSNLLRTLKLP